MWKRDIRQSNSCPNCGYPITQKQESTPQPQHSSVVYITEPEKKKSKLGILALIFSILGCTFFIGLILAITDLCRKDGTKKTCSIIALVISCIWLLAGIAHSNDSNTTEPTQNETQVEETDQHQEVLPQATAETESIKEVDVKPEKEGTDFKPDYDSIGDAFKQEFEDNFSISEENQENIDLLKRVFRILLMMKKSKMPMKTGKNLERICKKSFRF